MHTSSIGIFDSGFGGLTVLRGIVKALPDYDYIYLGDSARAPYGGRTKAEIFSYTEQAVLFLAKKKCSLIILACNTASSGALRSIQKKYAHAKGFPKVLGVLIPASEEAVQRTKNENIGVIATKRTVASGAFDREIKKLNSHISVFQKACPLLVPLIESGQLNTEKTKNILRAYLHPLTRKHIDTLILGCTHYGLMEKHIRAIVGAHVRIVSEERAVPKKLKTYLRKHADIEETISTHSRVTFYSTGMSEKFAELGSVLYGKKISVKKARIG